MQPAFRFGPIDALVNCAALDAVFGGLEEADWDSWRQALEINLFGTLQMTQAVIPSMKEHGGSVVFIGSQAMFWSQLPQAAYGASKAAILGAVTHLARELGPYGIRVNTVVPSWMWGPPVEMYVDMTSKAQNALMPSSSRATTRFPLSSPRSTSAFQFGQCFAMNVAISSRSAGVANMWPPGSSTTVVRSILMSKFTSTRV